MSDAVVELANAVVPIFVSLSLPFEAYWRSRNPPEVACVAMFVVLLAHAKTLIVQ